MEHNLFICECDNVEHQLIFHYDEGWGEVFMSIHLIPESNIFKRIWNALKYICGHRSNYGDFDEFIFNPKDADKLQDITNRLKQCVQQLHK